MKLNIETLREIVSSLVKEEIEQMISKVVNEAVEKRMRTLAVSLIAESRMIASNSALQPTVKRNLAAQPAQQVTQSINRLLKKPAPQLKPQNVMERVLLDTQQTTLREQRAAEQAQDQLPDEILQASSKFADLAFASPMPTRSSVMPKPDA